jgi:hypothetical protein
MNPKASCGVLYYNTPPASQDCSPYQFRRVTFRLYASLSELEIHEEKLILKPRPFLFRAAALVFN